LAPTPSQASLTPRDLHPSPTRRSSDLLCRSAARERRRRRRRRSRPCRARAETPVSPPATTRRECPHPTTRLPPRVVAGGETGVSDRKSTRLNSSHLGISYAVFCLKKKN